jgi:D-alanyl-D-alanine carboxypeptidase
MSLQLIIDALRSRWPYLGILVLVLGIAVGPALGQEGWGWNPQPEIAARSAVLMNAASGEIVFAKEPHLRLPPASTTKVLTALVTLERLDLNARLWVSSQAASAPPSRIGLRAGEATTTQDLLYGLLLKSGNDAAETLAEAGGGSVPGFARLMNARAWQIGARGSHFMNPHGLPDDDHFSTAYDLALIFRQAMNHPMFADIVRTRSAALRIESSQGLYGDWRMVPVVNHNRLLATYEGARGGKTGFTLKARRCFVGEVDRGGVRLIVSILNSPNSGALWQDARTLLDFGFARYGLAPPPPVQSGPLPVLVRHEPVESLDDEESDLMVRPAPVATRVAGILPASRVEVESPELNWQEEPEPVAAESAIPAKRAVAARTQRKVKTIAMAKPVAASRPVAAVKPVKAVRPVVAIKPVKAVRPVAAIKPVKAVRPVVAIKPVKAVRPVAASVAKPGVARPLAKSVGVAKPSKPLVLAMAAVKPMGAPDKAAKPSGKMAVKPSPAAPAKQEKRDTLKVSVRPEPGAKAQRGKR